MPSLTDVFVRVLADTSGFGRDLTRQLNRIDASADGRRVGDSFGKGVSGGFGKIAAGLAGAFAAVGAVSLFKGFITDAAEAEKITRITENTIRSMGNVANISASQITTLAGSLAAKTGVDDAAIQAGQNLLLTFGNVRNEVGKGNDVFNQATRLGLDMSVALGTDASTAALQLGKALNDPVKGITALSRAGVSFTEQQKEQIKTLVASGDTLGAQKIILGELEKQFGGTAAAAADPMARLSYVVGELGESVGALLLPAVSAFASFAGGTLIPAVQRIVDGFSGGEGAAGRFAGAFGGIKDVITVFVEALRGGEVTTLGFLGRVGDAGYLARDIFDTVRGGVVALVAAFRSGGEDITSSGFAGGMEQIGIFARDAFDYIKSDVIPAALAVGRVLGEVGRGALPVLVGAFKELFSAMTGVFNFIKANDTVFSSLAAAVVAGYVAFRVFTVAQAAYAAVAATTLAVTTAYRAVLQAYAFWTYTATGSTTAFAFAMNVLKVAFLTNPIGIVVVGLVALGAALVVAYKKSETFRDVVNGAWAAVRGVVGGVVDWFTGTVLPMLQGVWRGISSKAVELQVALSGVWEGIRAGFTAGLGAFGTVYDRVVRPVFEAFQAGAHGLQVAAQVAWDGIRAGFSAAMTGFRAVYQTLIAPVFVLFRVAAQTLWDGVEIVWAGLRLGFDLAAQGIRAVYHGVIVPVFNTYRAAALVLWAGVQVAWDGIRSGFDAAMRGVEAVYNGLIVPLFRAYRAAAQVLWDGLGAIWNGMRATFDATSAGVRAVYDRIIVPMFNAYRAAADALLAGLSAIWSGMRASFDTAMRGLRAVYDSVVSPLLDTFARGVDGLRGVFDAAVRAIGATWDTLRDKLRTPIKVAFDWVNANVIGTMNDVLSKFPGGISIPSLPRLAAGGPVKGPGGPTSDSVAALLSNGEYVVNAAAAKKHRRLLEDINKGRIQDEIGGPGDVLESFKGGLSAIGDFGADIIAKGARKAAEFLLGPIKDRLFAIIGSDNVAAAVLRGGLEKIFAAVISKGDEKDKELDAAKKAGGTGAFPGGGSGANLIAFGRLMQSMGARVAEHPSFGGVTAGGHANNSNHYIGRAVDVNYGPGGQNATEMAFFDRIVGQGIARQYGLRTLWRVSGHFNHLHADYDQGGWLMPGATGANRGTKPERVLTAAQTDSFDRLVTFLEKGQGNTRPPLVVNAYGAREETLAQHVLEGLRRRDALYQMG